MLTYGHQLGYRSHCETRTAQHRWYAQRSKLSLVPYAFNYLDVSKASLKEPTLQAQLQEFKFIIAHEELACLRKGGTVEGDA